MDVNLIDPTGSEYVLDFRDSDGPEVVKTFNIEIDKVLTEGVWISRRQIIPPIKFLHFRNDS